MNDEHTSWEDTSCHAKGGCTHRIIQLDPGKGGNKKIRVWKFWGCKFNFPPPLARSICILILSGKCYCFAAVMELVHGYFEILNDVFHNFKKHGTPVCIKKDVQYPTHSIIIHMFHLILCNSKQWSISWRYLFTHSVDRLSFCQYIPQHDHEAGCVRNNAAADHAWGKYVRQSNPLYIFVYLGIA